MSRVFSVVIASALCVPGAPAQVVTPGRLIGFTSSATSSSITRQALCGRPSSCASALPAPPAAWAGGAAYNAIHGSVWHTQGTRMAEVDQAACQLLCSVPANLTLGPGALASGLAVNEAAYELFQLETVPGAAAVHTFHIRSCPPQVIRTCRLTMPSNTHLAGGLAYDRKRELLWYSASLFGAAATPANFLIAVRRGDPNCQAVCRMTADGCGQLARLGPIVALAVDDCVEPPLIHASDGRQTATFRVDVANCNALSIACCPLNHPAGETWNGFDIEPIHPAEVGRSCIGTGCRNCPSMRLVAVGDPDIGNASFHLRIDQGQTGAIALLFGSPGRCSVPGVPVLCGEFHPAVPPPPILFGVAGLAGTSGCDGSALLGLPIPNDFALCDGAICFQGLVVCPTPVFFGTALTNAVQILIQ